MSTKQLHKKWRKEFNAAVFGRDKNVCKVCGGGGKLDAHHITDRHDLYAMIGSSHAKALEDSKNLMPY